MDALLGINAVAVYCGSSPGATPHYTEAVGRLGTELGRRGIRLVYGGARVGLMGVVADAALAAGGEVVGVLTEALADHELAHEGLTSLEVVATMHERKARMADLADAVVMAPGGIGTVEEFVEALTWSQLGIDVKPCGILNVDGYYDRLLEFFDHAVAERFLRSTHLEAIVVDADPVLLLDALDRAAPVAGDKWLDREAR